jgi:maleylpyruvate isomerase
VETSNPAVPHAWLSGCAAAHRRLESVLDGLNAPVSGATALEGWTLGHLLTHLARNADAMTGVVRVAQRGEVTPMYPGGAARREADIQTGAGRPLDEQIADVRRSIAELETAWAETQVDVWETGLGERAYGLTTLADFVALRWREVEVHLPDLQLSGANAPTWHDLSPAYVDEEWRRLVPGLGKRVPDGVTVVLVPRDRPSTAAGSGAEVVQVRAAPTTILRWLFGRGGHPNWPALGPW